jgi:tryptophanyl-tRNA synthetase
MFTKWLQDKFGAELYFEITNDENFLFKNATLEDSTKWGYDNILDIIALGFDPKKTFIFLDTEYAKTLYKIAVKVAKHVTFSTVKAVFGFTNETNIGSVFYPAIQASPCFLPSVLKGYNVPVLIPAAIDQDPYWRMTRDIAEKLGYYKPAQIHSTFLPSLLGEGKMSASDPNSAVFTTDSPEVLKNKIMKYAFSGGQDTIAEHRKKGGNPDVDVSYQWLTFFEEDDRRLKEIYENYRSGKLLTGELKLILVEKINAFLKEHQRRREKAKDMVDKFMLRD